VRIPLVDLVAQYRSIRTEIDAAIRDVLESGVFILGRNVAALEAEIAAYLGVRYAVGVASGTDALLLVLRALGIGSGDEVLVPAYTFFATAEAVSLCEARPIFIDVDPDTYCLQPAQLDAYVTPRTKAIIPVHLYGHPVDMDQVRDVATARGLKVVEDNAQAIGATYRGRKTGTFGDAGCLSFFPSKNLGAYGDAGMIVTNDPGLDETVRALRTHGWKQKYDPQTIGTNSRLDELQAAVLRVKLRHLERWTEARRRIAARYRDLLQEEAIGLPHEAPEVRHVYHLFVIRVAERNAVRRRLSELGVASGIYYPKPLHRLIPYQERSISAMYPVADRAAEETLAIPIYPEMTDDDVCRVAEAVRDATREARQLPDALGAGEGW